LEERILDIIALILIALIRLVIYGCIITIGGVIYVFSRRALIAIVIGILVVVGIGGLLLFTSNRMAILASTVTDIDIASGIGSFLAGLTWMVWFELGKKLGYLLKERPAGKVSITRL
jgi:hypothetical protein